MVKVPRALASLIVSRLLYLFTNPWLIGAVALLTLSFGALIVTGANELAQQEERHGLEIQQRLQASLQTVGPSGRQVDRALRVVRPPTVAALLIPGQDRSLPAAWDVGPAVVETLPPYPGTRLSISTGGVSDSAAIIAQFAGLLALALGLITVLRDRARGWTDAERGTSAPVWVFISTHTLAACLALVVVVGIWFGTIALTLNRVLSSAWPEANQTIAILAPVTWLYTVTLYGYGAAIGWHARSALRAVASAVVLWVCLALLGPLVVSSWSGDLPSRASAEQEQRDTYTDLVRLLESDLGLRIAANVVGVVSALERDRRVTDEFQALEPLWIRGMAEARRGANALEDAWRTESNHVAARFERAARVTPTSLLTQLLAEVSGTGSLARKRWEEAVADYKRRLDLVLFDDRPTVILRMQLDGDAEVWMHERHAVIPFRDLPQFISPTISARDRWQAAQGDALLLALHALAALTVAGLAQWRAWRRYDFASLSAGDIGRP